MDDARVTIVSVNYNGAAFIEPFLASLAALGACYRLIIVDCGSDDGSAEQIERLAPRARLLRLGENRGITGGNNAGIRAALVEGCDFVLFLNPDTTVAPDLLRALVAVATPCRLVTACVYLAARPGRMDDTAGEFDWRRGVWRDRLYDRPRPASFARVRRVGMASLTCLLVPAAALRALGGDRGPSMDERYFMYYDDFDFVRRLQALGYTLVYTPHARVYHRKSAAGGGVDSPFKHYYATRNRLLLMRSTMNVPAFGGFLLYVLAGRVPRAAAALAHRQPRVAWAMLRGVVDFLAGRTGRTLLPERRAGGR